MIDGPRVCGCLGFELGVGMGLDSSLQWSLCLSCLDLHCERPCSSVLAPRVVKCKIRKKIASRPEPRNTRHLRAAFRLSFVVDFLLSGVPHHTVRIAVPCVGDIDHGALLQLRLRHYCFKGPAYVIILLTEGADFETTSARGQASHQRRDMY